MIAQWDKGNDVCSPIAVEEIDPGRVLGEETDEVEVAEGSVM
jgi:hypothetical protein